MIKLSRKEQKEHTRTALVARAEAMFAKHGIGNTTTAEIAKALSVSHGTVFIHFATRDDLVLAVVDAFGERLHDALNEKLTDDLSLSQLLKAHIAVLVEFETFYLRLISESQSLPKHVRSIVYSINASLSYRFYRKAREQMIAGKVKRMDQPTFFNTWMALLHFYILNRDLFTDAASILDAKGDDILKQFHLLIKI